MERILWVNFMIRNVEIEDWERVNGWVGMGVGKREFGSWFVIFEG